MCFEMDDTGETILQWCQGTVVELVKGKEQQKYIDLKIKWDDSEQGDSITTIQRTPRPSSPTSFTSTATNCHEEVR